MWQSRRRRCLLLQKCCCCLSLAGMGNACKNTGKVGSLKLKIFSCSFSKNQENPAREGLKLM